MWPGRNIGHCTGRHDDGAGTGGQFSWLWRSGICEYTANWFQLLRGRMIVAELDQFVPNTGRPLPFLYELNTKRKGVRKLAYAAGVSLAVDSYGILSGQFVLGTLALASPVLKGRRLWKRVGIMSVWTTREKPASVVRVVGTNLPKGHMVVIGGRDFLQKKRFKNYGFATVIVCVVPRGGPYLHFASYVTVGPVALDMAFTVLAPDIDLVE